MRLFGAKKHHGSTQKVQLTPPEIVRDNQSPVVVRSSPLFRDFTPDRRNVFGGAPPPCALCKVRAVGAEQMRTCSFCQHVVCFECSKFAMPAVPPNVSQCIALVRVKFEFHCKDLDGFDLQYLHGYETIFCVGEELEVDSAGHEWYTVWSAEKESVVRGFIVSTIDIDCVYDLTPSRPCSL
jgi:hypothetical protein